MFILIGIQNYSLIFVIHFILFYFRMMLVLGRRELLWVNDKYCPRIPSKC
jgi:hypothetical protein